MNEQYTEPKKGLSTGAILAIVLGVRLALAGGTVLMFGTGLVLPALSTARQDALVAASQARIATIVTVIGQYEADGGQMPGEGWLETLVSNGSLDASMLDAVTDANLSPRTSSRPSTHWTHAQASRRP